MRFLKLLPVLLLTLLSSVLPISGNGREPVVPMQQEPLLYFDAYADKIYRMLNEPTLNKDVFFTALKGYLHLKELKMLNNDLLTIVDYTRASDQKRFFILDLVQKKIVLKTLVAHGRNSGLVYPVSFSNKSSSWQSSLGFFVTGEKFTGQHGNSLRLDGLERSINDNARERGIIIHAADYVCEDFVKKHGRLGRSQGCPALPPSEADQIIDMIQGKSCFFVFYPDQKYLQKSAFVNLTPYSSQELALLASE